MIQAWFSLKAHSRTLLLTVLGRPPAPFWPYVIKFLAFMWTSTFTSIICDLPIIQWDLGWYFVTDEKAWGLDILTNLWNYDFVFLGPYLFILCSGQQKVDYNSLVTESSEFCWSFPCFLIVCDCNYNISHSLGKQPLLTFQSVEW